MALLQEGNELVEVIDNSVARLSVHEETLFHLGGSACLAEVNRLVIAKVNHGRIAKVNGRRGAVVAKVNGRRGAVVAKVNGRRGAVVTKVNGRPGVATVAKVNGRPGAAAVAKVNGRPGAAVAKVNGRPGVAAAANLNARRSEPVVDIAGLSLKQKPTCQLGLRLFRNRVRFFPSLPCPPSSLHPLTVFHVWTEVSPFSWR